MGANYSQSDVTRMEREIKQLEMELRSRPDRADAIQTEINNLKYELEDAKRSLR